MRRAEIHTGPQLRAALLGREPPGAVASDEYQVLKEVDRSD
jgi:hypothetical protein